jgi:SAM-dependent methyltransferase
MRYNFGVYHWRRRMRAIALGALGVGAGVAGVRRWRSRRGRLLAAGVCLWGARVGWGATRRLLRPPPWRLDGRKYEALAAELPLDGAERLLDLGCGTGRSLVGLAPAVPADCTVVGVDVFDDRVILGNGPRLARRNAARAGLDAAVVRGDAARVPLATDAVDVVTISRVLHDLSAANARRAVAEARRVCAPDGVLGVLELPFPHEPGAAPATYWRDLVADAGVTVTTVAEHSFERGRYVVVVAEP